MHRFPTGFTLVWMGFMGNAALFSILFENQGGLVAAVEKDSSVALFEFLKHLPFSGASSLLATVLVFLILCDFCRFWVFNHRLFNSKNRTFSCVATTVLDSNYCCALYYFIDCRWLRSFAVCSYYECPTVHFYYAAIVHRTHQSLTFRCD